MLWALQELNLRPHAYQAERMSHTGANNANCFIDAPVPPSSASGAEQGAKRWSRWVQSGHCATGARVIAIAALAALAACYSDPIERRTTDNPNIDVSLLLTVEGCRVYRFEDARAVYVTICGDKRTASTASSHYESCGKSCTHTVDDVVNTVVKP